MLLAVYLRLMSSTVNLWYLRKKTMDRKDVTTKVLREISIEFDCIQNRKYHT